MFGLFGNKKHKREMQLLRELHEGGAAHSGDPVIRRRHCWLVHSLIGEEEALPLYQSIAARWPDDRRSAWIAATILLDRGDPAGLEPMERVAATSPSLAGPAYGSLLRFHLAQRHDEEIERLIPLTEAARELEERCERDGQFVDPGGPLGPPHFDEQDRRFIRSWMQDVRGAERLRGGSRALDIGGRQLVLVLKAAPGANEDEAMKKVAELASIYGDFVLYGDAPQQHWASELLEAIEGSALYP